MCAAWTPDELWMCAAWTPDELSLNLNQYNHTFYVNNNYTHGAAIGCCYIAM
jgi:hypothetical protein